MQTFEERLITAILTQAVEDAKYTGLSKKYLKHKIEAVNWILSDDPQFNYYCKLLNIEPSYIKNKVKAHADTKVSSKQKVLVKPIMKMLERKNNESRRIGIQQSRLEKIYR